MTNDPIPVAERHTTVSYTLKLSSGSAGAYGPVVPPRHIKLKLKYTPKVGEGNLKGIALQEVVNWQVKEEILLSPAQANMLASAIASITGGPLTVTKIEVPGDTLEHEIEAKPESEGEAKVGG